MKLVILTIFLGFSPAFAAQRLDLRENFLHPPPSSRPWVFWIWMNGNITSNGITADLEAMRKVGIGGVVIMEVDYDVPKGPIAFAGPEWRQLFKHVCAEGARLGLEIRMNNDAGYCGSGGPWITPELSMQKLVWSETIVSNNANLGKPLKQPESVENFYRDVAVLAFPTPADDLIQMSGFEPRFTASPGVIDFDPGRLTDRDTNTTVALPQPAPGNPSFIRVEFGRPFVAQQLILRMPLAGDQIVHGFLQASDDGQTFRTVREFNVIPSTEVFNFEEVAARHYRIFFPRQNPDVEQFVISELELSPRLRIEGIEAKALFARKHSYPGPSEFPGLAQYAEPRAGLAVPLDSIVDLTGQMDAAGKLRWEPPGGRWTVLRLGHTSTGKKNHPSPEGGLGLECDKLSKPAAEAAFEGLMGKLIEDVKPFIGKSLTSTHIDSWEVGSQNWTASLPAEFRQRRGYDLIRFLPVMAGRVLGGMEISERFLWDLRQTVSELVAENYAGHMRTLAQRDGLTLSIEAYDGPNDDLTYAGRADEPMGEFWTWPAFEMMATCTEMSSAAHVYGQRIISAEAFTAMDAEKWLGHPYSIKVFGDWAFCEGINRMVVHRYTLQPWTDPVRFPGMAFGPFGVHFERTQTWWEQSEAWTEYLARCQFLLQQGMPVSDFCYLAPQTAPRRWRTPTVTALKDGYAFDACPAEVLLNRMSVKDGTLALPDGMSYRFLALQETATMTPDLLDRLRQLALAGATIVGAPPLKSPSLTGYPQCDAEVRRMVREIWGDCDGKTVTEHRLGKGRVIWGPTPQEVLAKSGLPPDFTAYTSSGIPANFNYIHRSLPNAEVYFVANTRTATEEAVCAFRVHSSRPEFWWPDTGRVEVPAVYEMNQLVNSSNAPPEGAPGLRVPLRLGPAGSVFVVFPKAANGMPQHLTRIRRESQPVLDTAVKPLAGTPTLRDGSNSFTFAFWAKPEASTSLPSEAVFGKGNYFKTRNDALLPLYGHFQYQSPDHAGAGVSVGTNGIWVIEASADYWGSPLVYPMPITNWTHFVVVYEEGRPRLYINGRRVHQGLQSTFVVHCSVGVPRRHASAPFVGKLGQFFHEHRALQDSEAAQLMATMPVPESVPDLPIVQVVCSGEPGLEAHVWQPGRYVAEAASRQRWPFEVSLPTPIEVAGPWQVSFPEGWGTPTKTAFERLASWSDHQDAGIRRFSGTGTYSKILDVPASWLTPTRQVHLDLGQVAVMAEVILNGNSLGTLWKPPFLMDVTQALKPGKNQLELKVVNLWINRMIGDESLPEDSLRHPKGSLTEWPEWLIAGKPSPTGRFTFTTYRLWSRGDSLQPSGLIGPVKLIPSVRVTLE